MCRLAAYLGPPVRLETFLLQPEHSLFRQSWEPREMTEAVINADGFGFAWWNGGNAESYISTRPIWGDPNLPSLGRTLVSHGWLACVRSATPGHDIHEGNTQPFISDDGWVFVHNGLLDGFHNEVREAFYRKLPPEALARMRGNSDSEYWFALLRQHARQEHDILSALNAASTELAGWLAGGRRALLNTMISDGEDLFVCRHALQGPCPSLYYRIGGDSSGRATICASEPFDRDEAWRPVPEHTLLHLRAGELVASRPVDAPAARPAAAG